MGKRELGFRGFWITVAAVCIAGGSYLRVYGGHPFAGNRLVYSGLGLAALVVFGVLAEVVAGWAGPVTSPIVRVIRSTLRFVVESISWLGSLLLAPVIRRVLREERQTSEAPPDEDEPALGVIATLHPDALPPEFVNERPTWSARLGLGHQGSDFWPISREGHRLAGGSFIVRPDYGVEVSHVGFRLMRAGDDPAQSELTASVLFQVALSNFGFGRQFIVVRERAEIGRGGLPNYQNPTPSFLFDFSIYSAVGGGRLWAVCSINGDTPQRADFDPRYGEKLVLVAWADGRDFRAHFEQISVSWISVEGARRGQ
jgi:hypothetical protein